MKPVGLRVVDASRGTDATSPRSRTERNARPSQSVARDFEERRRETEDGMKVSFKTLCV
jgi:hypothetical protein